ncbi:hypothetical protein [Stratiformator vulcanicus]|uniref:Uncharacterized protein n=1 Tax=Stratiformator vulcanicus TaxID=2527980 RepID=A0A517R2M4_9PLAN|nr:hypothetical protein [Stratiformator vulcanicus]QDT38136.1 hypothetical protein Pan189_25260 [Stratiformator vulcanicus]
MNQTSFSCEIRSTDMSVTLRSLNSRVVLFAIYTSISLTWTISARVGYCEENIPVEAIRPSSPSLMAFVRERRLDDSIEPGQWTAATMSHLAELMSSSIENHASQLTPTAISQSSFEGRVSSDGCRGSFELVFQKPISALVLSDTINVNLRSVVVDGEDIPFGSDRLGRLIARLPRPLRRVTGRWDSEIQLIGSEGDLELTLPEAVVTKGVLSVPSQFDLTSKSGIVRRLISSSERTGRWEILNGSRSKLVVTLSRVQKGEKTIPLWAEGNVAATIGRDSVKTVASLRLRPFRDAVSSLRFSVPDTVSQLEISLGGDELSFISRAEGNIQIIDCRLDRSYRGVLPQLTVSTNSFLNTDQFVEVPMLMPVEAVTEGVAFEVQLSGGINVFDLKSEGMQQLSSRDDGSRLNFNILASNPSLRFRLSEQQPRYVAEAIHELSETVGQLVCRSKYDISVTSGALPSLEFRVPYGWDVADVQGHGKANLSTSSNQKVIWDDYRLPSGERRLVVALPNQLRPGESGRFGIVATAVTIPSRPIEIVTQSQGVSLENIQSKYTFQSVGSSGESLETRGQPGSMRLYTDSFEEAVESVLKSELFNAETTTSIDVDAGRTVVEYRLEVSAEPIDTFLDLEMTGPMSDVRWSTTDPNQGVSVVNAITDISRPGRHSSIRLRIPGGKNTTKTIVGVSELRSPKGQEVTVPLPVGRDGASLKGIVLLRSRTDGIRASLASPEAEDSEDEQNLTQESQRLHYDSKQPKLTLWRAAQVNRGSLPVVLVSDVSHWSSVANGGGLGTDPMRWGHTSVFSEVKTSQHFVYRNGENERQERGAIVETANIRRDGVTKEEESQAANDIDGPKLTVEKTLLGTRARIRRSSVNGDSQEIVWKVRTPRSTKLWIDGVKWANPDDASEARTYTFENVRQGTTIAAVDTRRHRSVALISTLLVTMFVFSLRRVVGGVTILTFAAGMICCLAIAGPFSFIGPAILCGTVLSLMIPLLLSSGSSALRTRDDSEGSTVVSNRSSILRSSALGLFIAGLVFGVAKAESSHGRRLLTPDSKTGVATMPIEILRDPDTPNIVHVKEKTLAQLRAAHEVRRDFICTSAEYTLTAIDDEVMKLEARFQVLAGVANSDRFAIPGARLVRTEETDAWFDGEPVELIRHDEELAVRLKAPVDRSESSLQETHEIRVVVSAPLQSQNGSARDLQLPLRPVPRASLRIVGVKQPIRVRALSGKSPLAASEPLKISDSTVDVSRLTEIAIELGNKPAISEETVDVLCRVRLAAGMLGVTYHIKMNEIRRRPKSISIPVPKDSIPREANWRSGTFSNVAAGTSIRTMTVPLPADLETSDGYWQLPVELMLAVKEESSAARMSKVVSIPAEIFPSSIRINGSNDLFARVFVGVSAGVAWKVNHSLPEVAGDAWAPADPEVLEFAVLNSGQIVWLLQSKPSRMPLQLTRVEGDPLIQVRQQCVVVDQRMNINWTAQFRGGRAGVLEDDVTIPAGFDVRRVSVQSEGVDRLASWTLIGNQLSIFRTVPSSEGYEVTIFGSREVPFRGSVRLPLLQPSRSEYSIKQYVIECNSWSGFVIDEIDSGDFKLIRGETVDLTGDRENTFLLSDASQSRDRITGPVVNVTPVEELALPVLSTQIIDRRESGLFEVTQQMQFARSPTVSTEWTWNVLTDVTGPITVEGEDCSAELAAPDDAAPQVLVRFPANSAGVATARYYISKGGPIAVTPLQMDDRSVGRNAVVVDGAKVLSFGRANRLSNDESQKMQLPESVSGKWYERSARTISVRLAPVPSPNLVSNLSAGEEEDRSAQTLTSRAVNDDGGVGHVSLGLISAWLAFVLILRIACTDPMQGRRWTYSAAIVVAAFTWFFHPNLIGSVCAAVFALVILCVPLAIGMLRQVFLRTRRLN